MPVVPILHYVRLAALVAATALILVVLAVTTAAGQTIRTFPADCPSKVQDCINASAAGDVVRIGVETPIAESPVVMQSLTLEAAPGVRPRLASGNGVFVTHLGTVAGAYVVRGLTLERGNIHVTQSATGPMRAAVVDNVILDSETGPFGAIDVIAFTLSVDTGPIELDVRGNDVTARVTLPNQPAVGIRLNTDGVADAAGTIAGNRVRFSERGLGGAAISVRNLDRTITVDVIGNATTGELYDAGVLLSQRQVGGTLTARVANNVIRGADAGERSLDGVIVDAIAGTVRATVVHNTIAKADDGILVVSPGAPAATVDVLVANNVVAGVRQRALSVPPAVFDSVRFGPNLLFEFLLSTLPVGMVIADPRFTSPADLRPVVGSPAVDAGQADFLPADLTTDFAGNPRVAGGAVDLGAFEAPCADGTFPAGPCPPAPKPAVCDVAACDDGDPCTADECRGDACVHVVRSGLDGARCACDRPAPAACDAIPAAVRRQTARACTLLARADGAARPARLFRRAAGAWARAARRTARPRATRPASAACRIALGDGLRDAERRTRALVSPAR